jgi:hypothetical protein
MGGLRRLGVTSKIRGVAGSAARTRADPAGEDASAPSRYVKAIEAAEWHQTIPIGRVTAAILRDRSMPRRMAASRIVTIGPDVS